MCFSSEAVLAVFPVMNCSFVLALLYMLDVDQQADIIYGVPMRTVPLFLVVI